MAALTLHPSPYTDLLGLLDTNHDCDQRAQRCEPKQNPCSGASLALTMERLSVIKIERSRSKAFLHIRENPTIRTTGLCPSSQFLLTLRA
jgi:hypothetical protein